MILLMIKLFSLFSGIGSFEKALTRLKIPFEIVGFSEIDKFAIKSIVQYIMFKNQKITEI